jgi:hypothetical protein
MGRTGARKRARIGFDDVHSAVDDHSRFAYSEILTDEKGPTCAGFLARAAAAFAAAGIERIEAVMTDNHWSYTHTKDLASVLVELGAHHALIKPHCPWQTARSTASTGPCRPSGPTARSSTPTTTAQPH